MMFFMLPDGQPDGQPESYCFCTIGELYSAESLTDI